MSHANAALTPRARLRLARLVVDQRLDPVAQAANVMIVCWPRTAEQVGRALPADQGPAGMVDRRSHDRTAARTRTSPQPVRREIVQLRWRHRLGPVQIAGQTRPVPPRRCTRCWSAAASTDCSRIDRVTGEPIRRYEHDHPGSLIHVDVTKFGNIPDGGGWRYVGRAQGDREPLGHRARHRPRTAASRATRSSGPGATSTPSLMTTPAWPTPRSAPTRQADTAIAVLQRARPPGSPTAASPIERVLSDNGSCLQVHTPGRDACAELSASRPSAPAPTGPRPTARSKDSTAPWPTDGPTSQLLRPAKQPAAPPTPPGCTTPSRPPLPHRMKV